VEIYLEPVIPAPRLLVFGLTPIAAALVRLGKAMGYRVDVVDPEADASSFPGAERVGARVDASLLEQRPAWMRDRVFAVVATQGERDEEAVQEAISAEPAYLGVVASRQRFAQIRETLVSAGVPEERIERTRNPAGLDINAKAPEEIALSILAEIVQRRRSTPSAVRTQLTVANVAERDAHDPVCGMTVQVAAARHTAEYDGRTYYFCCGGCRQRFLAAPEQYVVAAPSR
jgi:xanthine dehydrogenase accessory factor